jgi:hypothetical protein
MSHGQPKRPNTNYGIQHSGSGNIQFTSAAIGPGAVNYNVSSIFANELRELAGDVASEHPNAAAALLWLSGQTSAPNEPPEARDRLTSVKAVGGWLWDRFVAIVDSYAANLAPWIIVLVHKVAG